MALYRVTVGVVHHPGGIAGVGELIALDPDEGDPLCGGDFPVLERVPEPEPEPEPAPAPEPTLQPAGKAAKPRRTRTSTP